MEAKKQTITNNKAICNIKAAIDLCKTTDGMLTLAFSHDLWNEGIHKYMDSDTIPFSSSFDEEVMSLESESEKEVLRLKMIPWLIDCLIEAEQE